MTVGTGKFISRKVSKVRWLPQTDTSQQESSILVTGSWDDEDNVVMVWSSSGGEASLRSEARMPGEVTGLEWLGGQTEAGLVASTSAGTVTLFGLTGLQGLQTALEWKGLHSTGSGGATALACHGDNIATGGQDGRINILARDSKSPLKVYDKAESCSITAVTFTRASELVSSNMRGQLQTWDTRTNSQKPVRTCSQGSGVRCLATHPSQSHILMSGGQDGVLAVWDLRNPQHPATLLSADKAAISEVKFHPSQPDHVFTCSQGGDVCHWNSAGVRRDTVGVTEPFSQVSPWLSYEAVKHRVETHSLVTRQPLPVNSLDVVGGSLVFGGDTEAFYVLHNVIA